METLQFSLENFQKACEVFGGNPDTHSCSVKINDYTIKMVTVGNQEVMVDILDKNNRLVSRSYINQLEDIVVDKDAISFFNPEDNLTVSKVEPFIDNELI